MTREERFPLSSSCDIILQEGNITKVEADAIVNAANERMLGGGGVDGAIHRAAGPELLQACRAVPEVRPGVRCPRGEARITPGFRLPCRHVIHTVGPVYESPETSAPVLEAAYRSSLALAREHRLESIACPAISCGVYGYPVAEAAAVALEVCRESAGELREIRFVLFGSESYEAWLRVAKERLKSAR
jgi:O-acetyl-ADP-ribose deacetylase (regulator of RNase III)